MFPSRVTAFLLNSAPPVAAVVAFLLNRSSWS